MNITNWGNIPNITNQITTGAPQAGLRCDRGALRRQGCDPRHGHQRPWNAEKH